MQPSDFVACCLIFIDAVLSVLLYCKCCGAKKRCELHRLFVSVVLASSLGVHPMPRRGIQDIPPIILTVSVPVERLSPYLLL